MASEAPSWADQWGAGGIGAMEAEDTTNTNKDAVKNTKKSGLSKAKSFATAGAQKVKNSTSMSFNWVKNKCQKKNTSSS
ncbi:OLC1v1021174C1 [Oldenlandia corymbosa var. corymbosa]|uniref:OLC1v1021174C1 n=1 Tax=Oldenlandia corymbosa var. corymbosa TaxID=529605 RepID=A0AAV1BVD0_OLDCO|nr:OLC1v1021174C1 [Oldenlandia corymbosa var. corymbosa]